MARTILGVLAGIVLAWLVIMAAEFGSAALYPPAPGVDLRDPAQLATFIQAAPARAMVLVVAGWALGALFGGAIAATIGKPHSRAAALAVGAVVLAGVIANSLLIPHPPWMTVLGVLLPLPAAWLGSRVVR